MYLGQKDMRSLAALIEFAEMLIPRVTMIKPMAPKAAAARPPWDPDFIQRVMISIGFQRTLPYAVCAAAAVKMPSKPTMAADPMISKADVRRCAAAGLTENYRNDNGLDILGAGFVGVSRKIGDVQTQGGVVAQDSVEICEDGG